MHPSQAASSRPVSVAVIRVAIVAALALLGLPAAAGAVVSSTPDPAPQANGPVDAIVQSGSKTFLGGSFTRLGTPTPNGVAVAAATGIASTPALPVPDDIVDAVVSDGAGGWYIGGSFAHVGATAVTNLAHLLGNGTVDTAFTPNPDRTVTALALSPSGSTLYVGGTFLNIAGVATNRLAALNTTGPAAGQPTNFSASYNANGAVDALAVAPDGTLYVGGAFTSVHGGAANSTKRLAAFDPTGTPTAVSSTYSVTGTVNALAVAPDGATLYAGGSFSTVNAPIGSANTPATASVRIAVFNTATGLAKANTAVYKPQQSSTVNALALSADGGTLYAGGTFTTVNNGASPSQDIAAFDTSTGLATASSPNYAITSTSGSNATVTALALSGTTLYAGGVFGVVNSTGSPAVRNNVAAFDQTGVATNFDPDVDQQVAAVAVSGGTAYLGGRFQYVGPNTVFNDLAELNSDGSVDTAFNPNVNGDVDALVVSPDGGTLYAGGTFTAVNGGAVTAGAVAAFSTAGAGDAVAAFNPQLQNVPDGTSVSALAISPDGGKLYVGGQYNTIDGTTDNGNANLRAFNTSDGSLDATFSPHSSVVLSLALGGGELYAGLNPSSADALVARDPTTGALDTAFRAGINGDAIDPTTGNFVDVGGNVAVLLLSGSTLYAGGGFSFVNDTVDDTGAITDRGTARSGVAALDATTGTVKAFDAQLPAAECSAETSLCSYSGANALALAPDGSTLYLGGSFRSVAGTAQSGIAGVDPTSGALNPAFNPMFLNAGLAPTVSSLLTTGSRLYVGGRFTTAAGAPRSGFAEFSGPPPAPVVVTGGVSGVSGSGAVVAGSVNPNGTDTTYVFEYGSTLSFGSVTPRLGVGSGSAPVAVSATLSGLSGRTTYFYRLVAKTAAGETFGQVAAFSTSGPPVAPVVVTLGASSVGNTSVALAGQVDPEGQVSSFVFEYGPSLSFGAITPVDATDAAIGLESVSKGLSGLAADTTYFYRLVAANSTGTTFGAVASFTTGPGGAPVVATGSASNVTGSGATLAGTVDPHGQQTAFAFEYGTSTTFGSLSAVDSAGSTDGSESVSLPIGGLLPGTTYLYRIVATNASGTTTGAVQVLTTPPAG